jgi:hypothetical protein
MEESNEVLKWQPAISKNTGDEQEQRARNGSGWGRKKERKYISQDL